MPVPLRIAAPVAVALLLSAYTGHAPSRAPSSGDAAAGGVPRRIVERGMRDTARTTMDGVYTTDQAAAGADVFAAQCRSCHTPTVHTGPAFRAKWYGHSLGELFGYLRREMPKTDPGSMSDEEYVAALAYLLKMNGMPSGDRPLATDSTALHRIRLDSVRAAPAP